MSVLILLEGNASSRRVLLWGGLWRLGRPNMNVEEELMIHGASQY